MPRKIVNNASLGFAIALLNREALPRNRRCKAQCVTRLRDDPSHAISASHVYRAPRFQMRIHARMHALHTEEMKRVCMCTI